MARVTNTWTSTVVLTLIFLAALEARTVGAQGRPMLVRDINQSPASRVIPDHLTAVAGELYFTTSDGVHGIELWRSDGSDAGTSMVADVRPGPVGSHPRLLTDVAGLVFFVADDGEHGEELWVSDGTAEGTALVADIRPGAAGSSPRSLLATDDGLMFTADDGASGIELWTSDGTPEGTRRVADVQPGFGSSHPEGLVEWDGRVYFAADDGTHGRELWVSDGTTDGTSLVTDLNTGPDGSEPFGLLPHEQALYFGAFSDETGSALWRLDDGGVLLVADLSLAGADALAEPLAVLDGAILFRLDATLEGSQVWRTAGVPGDAELVIDFTPSGVSASTPSRIVTIGDIAYFVGRDPIGGAVLFRSDGTAAGTTILSDLNSVPCSAEYGPLVVLGERLYFATHLVGEGEELWTSDGTEDGTTRVADIHPGLAASKPAGLTVVGTTLFFRANDGMHGRELWKSDGTEDGTVIVADVFPGNIGAFEGRFTDLSPLGRAALFGSGLSSAPAPLPPGLWRSDGTSAGTAPIAGTESLTVFGFRFLPGQTRTYFWAHDATHGAELWQTDGTPEGTRLAVDIFPGPESSYPRTTAAVRGDDVFFAPETAAHGEELWFSDGTPAGTRFLGDLLPGEFGAEPRDLVVAGERVFFSARGGFLAGRELWTSDGTAAGTRLVKDINPGLFASGLAESAYATVLGTDVYFVASDGTHGRELWKSDGTSDGTFMVRDIRPGPQDGMTFNFTPLALGGVLLFTADDGASGFELWRTDGTEGGTFRVKDLAEGVSSSWPALFAATATHAYVVAEHPVHGRELWITDGTAAGTMLVKDIAPGPLGSDPAGITPVGDHVYFQARTEDAGAELWVSDGTAAGTARVGDINPGREDAYPSALTNVAGRLFFLADDGVHGVELWALSCGDGAADPSEQCDDGEHNGGALSCCTAICTLRPEDLDGDGTGDRCDPADATLELRRARVRADQPSPRPDGVITVDGHLAVDPASGDAFDAASGIAVTITGGGSLATAATWDAAACVATGAGIVRCSDRAQGATARFTPAGTDGDGRPRYFFRVRLSKRAIAGPFVGPMTATVTHGDAIDRVGALAGCSATARGMSCRP